VLRSNLPRTWQRPKAGRRVWARSPNRRCRARTGSPISRPKTRASRSPRRSEFSRRLYRSNFESYLSEIRYRASDGYFNQRLPSAHRRQESERDLQYSQSHEISARAPEYAHRSAPRIRHLRDFCSSPLLVNLVSRRCAYSGDGQSRI